MKGHRIDLEGIGHSYGSFVALTKVDMNIAAGELIALLGPSGCGKTTLLKIIAGFMQPSQGAIKVDGDDVVHQSTGERNVGIVFQNYALFPHMTIERNVSYGLRARHLARAEVHSRTREMLQLVKMENFSHRYPGELSGGQQQRVALARALAVKPKIVLLDEPFSALDRGLRLDMQMEVKSLLKQYGVTSILVTHDQEEALSMADRIVVLRSGSIEQIGTAAELYDRPKTLFVNNFLGQSNLLVGVLEKEKSGAAIRLDCGARIPVSADRAAVAEGRNYLSIRPENLSIESKPGPERIPAMLKQVVPLGSTDVAELEVTCGTTIKIALPHKMEAKPLPTGEIVYVAIENSSACSVFPMQGE